MKYFKITYLIGNSTLNKLNPTIFSRKLNIELYIYEVWKEAA